MSRPPAPRRPEHHTPRRGAGGPEGASPGGREPDASGPGSGVSATGREVRAAGRGRRATETGRPRVPRPPGRPVGARDAVTMLGSHEESVSAGFEERLAERRRARWHLAGVRLLVVVAAVLVVAGTAWTVFFSPLFALSADSVTVSGESGDVSAEDVRAEVAPFVGIPLTRLDTGAVRDAVDSLTPVRSSEVAKSWPRGLTVRLTMRTATMVVEDGDRYSLVDDQGVEVATTDSLPTDLPLVTLPDSGDARTRAAGDVAVVWAALGTDLRSQTTSLSADGATVTLALTSGRSVVWGTSEDSDLKAEVLGLLLAQREATTYDVSSPHRPVTS